MTQVVRIPETSQATFDAISAWGKAMGKVTVECKDTPGFIVNRLLVPYMMEAVKMLERGLWFSSLDHHCFLIEIDIFISVC